MTVEIDPKPTPEEREALLAALAGLDQKPTRAPAWWRAGLTEALGDEQDEQAANPVESPNRTFDGF